MSNKTSLFLSGVLKAKKNAVGDGFGPVDGRFGAEDLPVLLLVSPAYRRLRKNARRELSVGFEEFVSRKMSEKCR